MTTYRVFLRNGEQLKIEADGYNRMRGNFYVKTENEESKNKTRNIADFETKEILGIVEEENIVE